TGRSAVHGWSWIWAVVPMAGDTHHAGGSLPAGCALAPAAWIPRRPAPWGDLVARGAAGWLSPARLAACRRGVDISLPGWRGRLGVRASGRHGEHSVILTSHR